MVISANPMLSFDTTLTIPNKNIPQKKEIQEQAIEDNFSWKYGTIWENWSDEKIKLILEETKNSFQKFLNAYNILTQDMPIGENSLQQKMLDGTLDTALMNEINSFVSKNSMSRFATSAFMDLYFDKEVEILYRTATNIDEFKAGWLELKEKRSKEIIDIHLKGGNFEGILSMEDMQIITEILKKQAAQTDSAQENDQHNTALFNQINPTTKQGTSLHNPNEESKNFTPLQVISKSQTYKDLNFFTMNNLLQDQYKFNMFEMLFGKNTIKTSINIRA